MKTKVPLITGFTALAVNLGIFGVGLLTPPAQADSPVARYGWLLAYALAALVFGTSMGVFLTRVIWRRFGEDVGPQFVGLILGAVVGLFLVIAGLTWPIWIGGLKFDT